MRQWFSEQMQLRSRLLMIFYSKNESRTKMTISIKYQTDFAKTCELTYCSRNLPFSKLRRQDLSLSTFLFIRRRESKSLFFRKLGLSYRYSYSTGYTRISKIHKLHGDNFTGGGFADKIPIVHRSSFIVVSNDRSDVDSHINHAPSTQYSTTLQWLPSTTKPSARSQHSDRSRNRTHHGMRNKLVIRRTLSSCTCAGWQLRRPNCWHW